jgi:LuxR family maltose regulon positive regulatory protein
MALAYLAEIAWLHGDLRKASRLYDQARELAARWGGQSSIALNLVELGRAQLLYEADDLEGTALALRESIRIGEAWRNTRALVQSLGLAAAVARARGQAEDARAAIHRAERLVHDAPSSTLVQAALAVRQLALSSAEEDRQVVARWQAYFDSESPSLPAHIGDGLAIALAGAWIARRHRFPEDAALAQAGSLVEPALERSQRDGRALHVTRLLILDSLVRHARGEVDRALASLERALDEALPQGYLRSFVDHGEAMEALLRRALKSQALAEPTAAYVRELLSRFPSRPPVEPSLLRPEPLIEPLTEREMEVLALIAKGLSNQQIADRLFLALSTVKGHARIIFDKLGVQRRTEAVARARELGLL